jgi:dihydrofolate reductase
VVQDGKRKGEIVGKTIMGAVVSLDGFMADDNDDVGPLFDWLGNGDVAWSFPGSDGESRTTQASADFMLDLYGDMAANVIGRRVFDLTNGWNGKPAAGEHVFVVTHRPPTDWEYADTAPFTLSTASRRRLRPPRSSPATGSSTWPPVRSAARRSRSG